jgi:SSS family solute:Na+ symporter
MSTGMSVMLFATIYLVVCVGLSMYAAKRKVETSQKDFYVASGGLGVVVLFLTSLATAFSAFAFQGQLGQTYNFGLSAIFNFFGYGVVSYPLFIIIGSKLWYFGKRYGYITPADFIADRYEANAASRLLVGAIISVYFSIFYIVIQMKACSWVIQAATGMDPTWATLIITAVLGLYVVKGGMRAVAYVDVMQALFLMAGTAIIVASMIYYTGGIDNLFNKAIEINPDIYTPRGPFSASIGGGLVMWLSMPIWPILWTKYYCAKDMSTMYSVATGCGLGTVLVTVSAPLFIVAGLMVYFPNAKAADADNLVIEYILKFTNPVVASCVVGGLLSAAMSTAGALLLLISSVFTQDLPKALPQKQQDVLSEEKKVFFGRVMVFVVLGVCFFISLRSLGQLVTMGIQLAYPGYLVALPAVIGGIWWKKGNGVGMTYGLIAGLAAIYYTTYVDRNPLSIHSGLWGLGICAIVYIAASLLTKPNSQRTLARFGLADGQKEEAATMDALSYAAKYGKKI